MRIRKLKPLSVVILIVFTFFSLRVDILAESMPPQEAAQPEKEISTAAQFQKLLVDTEKLLEEIGSDWESGEDVSAKLTQLTDNKATLNQLVEKLRTEFNEIRVKLEAEGASPETIQRHDEFVQKFEATLATLLGNIGQIEAAENVDLKGKVKGAKDHLKANLHKKKHIPLDPKKLPRRSPKVETREPITDPAEFKKLFPESSSAITPPVDRQQASLSLSDCLSWLLGMSVAYAEEGQMEGQFTQEIQDLAARLDYNPGKIYEYVRNNFDYEPYYGSLKGPQGTLLEGSGNDFDLASLLIELYRASNISCRYVYGTVEVPIEKAMKWAGVKADWIAGSVFVSNGIPSVMVLSGGKITKVRMEHVWVEAFVDYVPSGGAIHEEGDTWIPLDPSFKQYSYDPEARDLDPSNEMPFDMTEYLGSANPLAPTWDYTTKLLPFYFQWAGPDAVIPAPFLTMERETLEVLPTSLPYILRSVNARYDAVPDGLKHKIRFKITDPTSGETKMNYQVTTQEIASKRLTLSYIPASPGDESVVNSYGTIFDTPAYLFQVKPVLKLDGETIVAGNPTGMGQEQVFSMEFAVVGIGTDRISNVITAGDYAGIGINLQQISGTLLKQGFTSLENGVEAIGTGAEDRDDVLGQLLYQIAVKHLYQTDGANAEGELLTFVKDTRQPISEAIVSTQTSVEYLFGLPYTTQIDGIGIDVDRDVSTPFSIEGNEAKKKQYGILSGISGSFYESASLENTFGMPSVSAVTALQLASAQGIPIHEIDASNVGTLLPALQVSEEVKSDILNAVNAGNIAIVSQTEIQYNEWLGVGYIILDPATGAGAYKISGGLSGAGVTLRQIRASLELTYDLDAIWIEEQMADWKPWLSTIPEDAEAEEDIFEVGGFRHNKEKSNPSRHVYDLLIKGASKTFKADPNETLEVPPELLKALIRTESSYIHIRGSLGPEPFGLTQITQGALSQVRTRFNRPDLDRIEPGENILAGLGYLILMYNIFDAETGDERWKFALGSYNAGAGYIIRAQQIIIEEGLPLPTDQWDSIVYVGENYEVKVGDKEWDEAETIPYVDKVMTFYKNDRARYDELVEQGIIK